MADSLDYALLVAFDSINEFLYGHRLGGKQTQNLLVEVRRIALLSSLTGKAVVAYSARLRHLVAEVLLDDATTALILLVCVVEQMVKSL